MLEVWTSKEKLDALEADWRAAWKASSSTAWHSPPQSSRAGSIAAAFIPTAKAETRIPAEANSRRIEDDLYQRLIDQRVRYHQSVGWYRRVSQRVQTRLDEDEMLYSTLGMLVSSPMMLVFYPIVRWNVRSVLWDEGDPDSQDDAVRRFCAGRLEGIDQLNEPP
jgi:hypothetical protein